MTAVALTRFRRQLEQFGPLPDAEWEAMAVHLSPLSLARGECFVRQGELDHRVAFIASGAMRAFYTTQDGTEATRGFAIDDEFIAAYSSALTGTPANVTIEALEPTEALCVPYQRLVPLFDRHGCWQVIGRRLAEHFYLVRERHGYQLLAHDAEQRYQAFLDDYPALAARVPLKYIASYLGITPEFLSRLRKRKPL